MSQKILASVFGPNLLQEYREPIVQFPYIY